MNESMNFLSKIKLLAKNKNMPIKELSKKITITQPGFYTSFRNNSLKVNTLLKISEVLDVDINYFFSDVSPSGKNEKIIALENEIKSLKDKLLDLYSDKEERELYIKNLLLSKSCKSCKPCHDILS